MTRPDWRVAGATGLLAGIAIGGFTLTAGAPVDRAIRAIELQEAVALPGGPATSSPIIDRAAERTLASPAPAAPSGDDELTASVASPAVVAPPIVSERSTPIVELDSDDAESADEADSADSVDATD
jgi:hypothetical protein